MKSFGGFLQRSFAPNKILCPRPKHCPFRRIIDPAAYRCCKTDDISFREQQPRLAVNNNFGNASRSLSDHWQPGGLRLEISQSIGFSAAGPDIDAGLA